MQRLDENTVRAVELTAPGACQADAQSLRGRIHSGAIFGAFSEQERKILWTKLCSATTDKVIPSLFGFFENLKYLQNAADCMKRLVHLESKETIRSAFETAFYDADGATEGCLIQVSPSRFGSVPIVGVDRFDV